MGTIVVGVDGSAGSHDALRWAVGEASRRQVSVDAVFAWTFPYVVPVAGRLADDSAWQEGADKKLQELLGTDLSGLPAVKVTGRAAEGPAARILLDAARGADMLVVGARGRGGFAGLLLGSVSQQCVQHADCPVVVVRHGDASSKEEATERIVVGVDASETARAALHWALDEARVREATVDVVHAGPMPYLNNYPYAVMDLHPGELERDARQLLDRIVDGADTTGVRAVEPILVCDSPARALLDTAKGADLLVVGSRGRGGFTGLLLGSVSQQVVHHASCPVVVIPPPT